MAKEKENKDQVVLTAPDAGAPEAVTATATATEVVKVRFIASPTGRFGLAYNIGEECEININQAAVLIDAGYAEIVNHNS